MSYFKIIELKRSIIVYRDVSSSFRNRFPIFFNIFFFCLLQYISQTNLIVNSQEEVMLNFINERFGSFVQRIIKRNKFLFIHSIKFVIINQNKKKLSFVQKQNNFIAKKQILFWQYLLFKTIFIIFIFYFI